MARNLDRAAVQKAYLDGIEEGVIGADDVIQQLDGLLDFPGYEFAYPIVNALHARLLQDDAAEARRLREVVDRRKPGGWQLPEGWDLPKGWELPHDYAESILNFQTDPSLPIYEKYGVGKG